MIVSKAIWIKLTAAGTSTMAPYNPSYGAVHEPTQNTSLLEQAHSHNSSAGERDRPCRRVSSQQGLSTWSLSRSRNWLATAVLCGLAVGMIMATGRPRTTSATDDSSSGSQAEPSHGSLLAGRLPVNAKPSTVEGGDEDIFRVGPVVSDGHETNHNQGHGFGVANSSPEKLDYTMTNFYHTRDGKPGQQIPWLENIKLAEPYRDTKLTVVDPRDGYSYHWEIVNPSVKEKDKRVMFRAMGAEVTAVFTVLDVNRVLLREVNHETGDVVRSLEESVMVKYVRREIRTLLEEEREELMDAVSVYFLS